MNLLSAITPPLRGRLDVLRDLVPIAVPETASALVAAAGIALLVLSWGVRRGQRRAWMLAVGITALSAVLHIVKGLDVEEAAAAFAVLGFLIVKRRAFTAVGERPSMGRALATLAGGAVIAVLTGTATLVWLGRRTNLSIGRAMTAVSERLVGDQDIAIPGRRGRFLTPTLGAVGLTLVAVAAWLLFRPVVARYNAPGELARARETVRRYGGDTLVVLRPPRRQAALVLEGHARRLRGAQRRVPRVARPDRSRVPSAPPRGAPSASSPTATAGRSR